MARSSGCRRLPVPSIESLLPGTSPPHGPVVSKEYCVVPVSDRKLKLTTIAKSSDVLVNAQIPGRWEFPRSSNGTGPPTVAMVDFRARSPTLDPHHVPRTQVSRQQSHLPKM